MPKQRFFLPRDYAELIGERATAAGVSPDIYLQTLITQDYIGGQQPPQTQPAIAPLPATDEGLQLSGEWGALSL
ncbi:hypothetical protein VB780_25900 [Leptolyngbya sp. CCNP1308]|uniref:hypothetical protein n=1 Tax=Leptolyngbya sp. CCNP1308 TaxID=3110255 RepID=UPI002B20CCD9|nr:hypothetical protein [Leptolyngbya sp. CCNP1308]MEA5452034.1 hypothetical protein [Leptolyngbya sp. CCNP1308]